MCQFEGNAELTSQAHDFRFREFDQRRVDTNARAPLDAGFGGEVAHLFESMNELGPAIRIAGVIERVDADVDVVGFEHFGPCQRERKKDRVARRHVGDRNPAAHGRFVAALGNGDVVREGGVAEYAQSILATR